MNSMPASNVKLWRKNWETFGSTEVGTRKYQLSKGDPQKPGKMFTIQHPKQLNIYRDPNKKNYTLTFYKGRRLEGTPSNFRDDRSFSSPIFQENNFSSSYGCTNVLNRHHKLPRVRSCSFADFYFFFSFF